jgi:hypothetical protein
MYYGWYNDKPTISYTEAGLVAQAALMAKVEEEAIKNWNIQI